MPFVTVPDFPARHAFSTRRGGVSPAPYNALDLSLENGDAQERTDENARRFAGAIGVPVHRIATVHQVHGTRIVQVVGEGLLTESGVDAFAVPPTQKNGAAGLPAPLADADGLVTDVPGIALAIRTADCTPVLLASKVPSVPAIAAVHAGWRGTIGDIAGKAVRLLCQRFGLAPGQLAAAIGPCISSCCYQVSEQLADDFAQAFGTGSGCVVRIPGDDRPHLDLKSANRTALLNAGLSPSDIHASALCTACERDLFFSHRRDNGRTGRMLSAVWIRS